MAYWYAVYTRPCWEKKVADAFQRRRLEHYCPQTRVAHQWNDKRKAIYQPVFASYVFVRTSEETLRALRNIDGVINIVYWRDKPAVIRDIEVEMMKRFLNEHECVNLEKMPVNTSEIVKIINSSLPGKADERDTIQKIKLVLPSLGFTMEAIVEKEEVNIILQPETRQLNTTFAKIV